MCRTGDRIHDVEIGAPDELSQENESGDLATRDDEVHQQHPRVLLEYHHGNDCQQSHVHLNGNTWATWAFISGRKPGHLKSYAGLIDSLNFLSSFHGLGR